MDDADLEPHIQLTGQPVEGSDSCVDSRKFRVRIVCETREYYYRLCAGTVYNHIKSVYYRVSNRRPGHSLRLCTADYLTS